MRNLLRISDAVRRRAAHCCPCLKRKPQGDSGTEIETEAKIKSQGIKTKISSKKEKKQNEKIRGKEQLNKTYKNI